MLAFSKKTSRLPVHWWVRDENLCIFVSKNRFDSDMETINREIAALLCHMGIDKDNLGWGTRITIFVGILLVAYIFTKIFHYLIMPAIHKITARTKVTWDDYLFNEQMLTAICRMIPPVIVYFMLPFSLGDVPWLLDAGLKLCLVYMVICTLRLVNAFLDSLYEISNEHETFRNRPLKSIYQTIKLAAICIGIIMIISILLNRNAGNILVGLGASATVLMLIFKDSILGLVAGVQLSANDMLRPGDWITMDKYGANGYVTEVSLTTVKVQNFDKTITTIPPYALVSDAFQNWRGMWESGSRRIKRSLFFDMNTIRFCTEEETESYVEKGWLSKEEAEKGNTVNLLAFRNFVMKYLNSHPRINHESLSMVRQMDPTTEGLPVEIYCFAATTEWPVYESIQSEVFDYLIASVPLFGLKLFQRPSGLDLNLINQEA